VCRRHHIRRLSLFGSVLKGTNRPENDVDLLVEFERGKEPGLIGLARIEAELSALLNGRPVDLRTLGDLRARASAVPHSSTASDQARPSCLLLVSGGPS
jgi:predicted nucleotidyltransferase